MTAPVFVLEVTLEPTEDPFWPLTGTTDFDELVQKAEGFIKALYGFVTDRVVNEPDCVAWTHPGQPVGGQYVAYIYAADSWYADLMDEAQTRQPVLEDSYWLMLMEGAAIEAAHRLKARGGGRA